MTARTRGSRLEIVGAFESTYLPAHDADIIETSGHAERWRQDLELMRELGATRLRYPIRWQRVEQVEGSYDWAHTDEVLGFMRDEGFRPIVDLVHHTSYPRWLEDGFADERFGDAYLAYAEAVGRRYPWIEEYTLFNEPFATLFLSGHEAVWPPYHHGVEGFVGLLRNVLPPVAEASRRFRELLPHARHLWTDSCEGHAGLDAIGEEFARYCDDRRFFAIDAFLGRAADRDRPFVADVVAAGGEDLLELEPGVVDVLGLDYYAHHEWCYRARRGTPPEEIARRARHPHGPGHPQAADIEGIVPSRRPRGLAALAAEYHAHAGLPMILAETNLRGSTSDRATFLKHALEQVEQARAAGVPIEGFCWFGFLDSLDWGSLLSRCDRDIDPVGVIRLDERLERHESSMSRAWSAAANGASAASLPAYRFTPATADWLRHLMPLMSHFEWTAPPADEVAEFDRGVLRVVEDPLPELVVFSHLRWDFVWQRPQHLVSRLAAGRRAWFVEECVVVEGLAEPRLRVEPAPPVTRVWLEVPGEPRHAGFDDAHAEDYADLVAELLGPDPKRTVWTYTPMALPLVERLEHGLLVYDVMDDLASFRFAPPAMRLNQQRLLHHADVVFAGGRSIHAGVEMRASGPVHLFPSGVEPEHYGRALAERRPRERPVAGYVGVIDERIDLDIVAGLAAALPGWDIRMVGPVAKIDPASLPQAPNLQYPGMATYDELPSIMGGFDVALMPFALNAATRSISPTKTLEYLAAGLPIVSTRVPDVVSDFGDVVALRDDARGFAAACRETRERRGGERDAKVRALLRLHHWDTIANRMQALMDDAAAYPERLAPAAGAAN